MTILRDHSPETTLSTPDRGTTDPITGLCGSCRAAVVIDAGRFSVAHEIACPADKDRGTTDARP